MGARTKRRRKKRAKKIKRRAKTIGKVAAIAAALAAAGYTGVKLGSETHVHHHMRRPKGAHTRWRDRQKPIY